MTRPFARCWRSCNQPRVVFFDEEGLELVVTADEAREMDRRATADYGLPGRLLMELAGAGTAAEVLARVGRRWARAVILCGPGGNGGDGYVIARHLLDHGWEVRCVSPVEASQLTGDARTNRDLWDALGGETVFIRDAPTARVRHHLGHAHAIVDALYGTGQSRALEPPAAELVAMANAASHGIRVAVDVPSGVDANTGACLGEAFDAHLTTTYGLPKAGLVQGPGALLAGDVRVIRIGLPRSVVMAVGASHRLVNRAAVREHLPARPQDGHKGTFGHVGVVGGATGMEGAALLAARGALRSGAGLVTWNIPDGATRDLDAPEVMTHGASDELDLRSEVLVVGPGMGQGSVADGLVARALSDARPRVLDADALNSVAARGVTVPAGSILTPHPAEAGRLLGVETAEILADRLGAARALAERFDATIVLKGAGTVIATPGAPAVIHPVAAPALAVAGSGDVLAGVIGGLRAQGVPAPAAAMTAVWLHGHAGRALGQERGDRGALPQEIADAIPGATAALLKL